MNKCNAEPLRGAHGIDFHPCAIEQDFPAARRLHARENFHERAFPRAILAHNSQHFAMPQRERDILQRQHAGKAFGDGPDLEEGSHFLARSCKSAGA
jgi:hypothetical protein